MVSRLHTKKSVLAYIDRPERAGPSAEEAARNILPEVVICPLFGQGFDKVGRAIAALAELCLREQESADPESSGALFDSSDVVLKELVASGKLDVIVKLFIAAAEPFEEHPASEARLEYSRDLAAILKCATDAQEALSGLNHRLVLAGVAGLFGMSEQAAQRSGAANGLVTVCTTLAVYILYNYARSIDNFDMGTSDAICRLFAEHRFVSCMLAAWKFGLQNPERMIPDDGLVTMAETLAALAEAEPFLDNADAYFEGDAARDFIRFYDAVVAPLLTDPAERGKMLCLDDVLSYIRRHRPEAEAAVDAQQQ